MIAPNPTIFKDIVAQLEKMIFFLNTFDDVWNSGSMKNVFPAQGRDVVDILNQSYNGLNQRNKILEMFADWREIGVWNVMDLITFLISSRINIGLHDAVKQGDRVLLQDSIRYIFDIINYLLLTNIHKPNTNSDEKNFNPQAGNVKEKYLDAQKDMREVIAEHFADEIWNSAYRAEVSSLFDPLPNSLLELKANILDQKEGLIPESTPSLLVKNVGLAKEIFVHYKFTTLDLGYIIPTLLYQRLFKGISNSLHGSDAKEVLIATPDFLLINKGRILGLELGRESWKHDTGKGPLIASFSGATLIPTTQINVKIGTPVKDKWFDFGFKCNRCYRCFGMCSKFIEAEIGNVQYNGTIMTFEEFPAPELICENVCGADFAASCPDAALFVKIMNYDTGNLNQMLIHRKCWQTGDDEFQGNDAFPLIFKIDELEAITESFK